jgi:hypothetical protein
MALAGKYLRRRGKLVQRETVHQVKRAGPAGFAEEVRHHIDDMVDADIAVG